MTINGYETNELRAMCAELLQELCCHYRSWELKEGHCSDAMNRARALLDQQEPAGVPTDEELYELWEREGHEGDFQDCRRFYRSAIAHWLPANVLPTPEALP